LKPNTAIPIAVQLSDDPPKKYVVDGNATVGTFSKLFLKEQRRLSDANGEVTDDLFLKSIVGPLVVTAEPGKKRKDFVCTFCSGKELFPIVIAIGEKVERLRAVIARRCGVTAGFIVFEHNGKRLHDEAVLSDLEIGEVNPIHILEKGTDGEARPLSAPGNPALDASGRPSGYDLLVVQLARVSRQNMGVCRGVFAAHDFDYDAALAELRSY
jgi:hypothetical protein